MVYTASILTAHHNRVLVGVNPIAGCSVENGHGERLHFPRWRRVVDTMRNNAQDAIDERRYCVWQCPTHVTRQRPAGRKPKAGCGHWQYKKTNPNIPSQGRCKRCHKRPRLHIGSWTRTYANDTRGKNDAKAFCEMANDPKPEHVEWFDDEEGNEVYLAVNV